METWRDIMILIGPHFMIHHVTGKFLSEALFFALSNPQYDDRLHIELPVQYMKITSSEHQENMQDPIYNSHYGNGVPAMIIS